MPRPDLLEQPRVVGQPTPSDGIISLSLGSQASRSGREAAFHDVEHGRDRGRGAREAPSRPAMLPSAAVSTVVPNSSTRRVPLPFAA